MAWAPTLKQMEDLLGGLVRAPQVLAQADAILFKLPITIRVRIYQELFPPGQRVHLWYYNGCGGRGSQWVEQLKDHPSGESGLNLLGNPFMVRHVGCLGHRESRRDAVPWHCDLRCPDRAIAHHYHKLPVSVFRSCKRIYYELTCLGILYTNPAFVLDEFRMLDNLPTIFPRRAHNLIRAIEVGFPLDKWTARDERQDYAMTYYVLYLLRNLRRLRLMYKLPSYKDPEPLDFGPGEWVTRSGDWSLGEYYWTVRMLNARGQLRDYGPGHPCWILDSESPLQTYEASSVGRFRAGVQGPPKKYEFLFVNGAPYILRAVSLKRTSRMPLEFWLDPSLVDLVNWKCPPSQGDYMFPEKEGSLTDETESSPSKTGGNSLRETENSSNETQITPPSD